MYRKVLIPLDGDRESEGVIPLIVRELTPETEVILLQVIRPLKSQVVAGQVIMGMQREDAERAEAVSYLRGLARQHEGATRWRCESTVANASSRGIVDFAHREGVDLIAMYEKERKGLARLMKGNTARAVQRKAPAKVRMFSPQDLKERVPQEVRAAAPARVGATDHLTEEVNGHDGPIPTFGALEEVDLFKDFNLDQIDAVTSLGRRLSVSTGEELGRRGELGHNLFIILDGEAQLTTHSEVGDISIRVAGPGESFPLATLLGSGTLITTGKALTNMEVLAVPRTELLRLCSENTEIGMRAYKTAAQIFAGRYSSTLTQLALSVEREIQNTDEGWLLQRE